MEKILPDSLVQLDTVDSKTMVTQANTTKLGMSYANCEDYRRQHLWHPAHLEWGSLKPGRSPDSW